MNKVIGIISYLPSDQRVRKVRIQRLSKLLEQCKNLFDLPVLIIAQNWKDTTFNFDNITVYHHDNPLGIIPARKELREIFLNSEYDYLIMLDDDCELFKATPDSIADYLRQIDKHPNMYGKFSGTNLKLFAISKYVYSKVDYPEVIDPTDGGIFEDIYLVSLLDKTQKNNCFVFNRRSGLQDISNSSRDKFSTWYTGQFNKKQMGDRTRSLVSKWKY